MATLLVGHVTKDGAIAGPRLLEHLVDVVLQLRGRPALAGCGWSAAVKNRYGPTDEVGCFELHDDGHRRAGRPVRAVPDPPHRAGARHLRDRHPGGPPAAGRRGAGAGRADAQIPAPRRTRRAWTTARVAMMLAVLERRGRIAARRAGRLRRDRRRRAADRARRRPRGGAGGGHAPPATRRCPPGPGRDRRGRPRRARSAGSRGVERRLAEAARLGFTARPGARRTRARLPAGMRVDRGRRPRRRRCGRCRAERRVTAAARDGTVHGRTGPARSPARPTGAAGVRRLDAVPRDRGETQVRALARTAEATLRDGSSRRVAPGTALRDGLERILRGNTGGADRARHRQDRRVAVHRRLRRSTSSSPRPGCASWPRWTARSSLDTDVTRIVRAGVQLVPDPTIPTEETGTRHRTAERVAKQTGFPVISVSQSMRIIALYVDGPALRPRGLRGDPVPRQPGAGHPGALQAAPRRGRRHAVRAGDRGPGHGPRRHRGRPAAGDGAPDRRPRSTSTSSSSAPTAGCCRSSSTS